MFDLLITWITGQRRGGYHAAWFTFEMPIGVWAGCGLLVLVFAAGFFFWHRRLRGMRRAGGLALLRTAALGLALFLALGPGLMARRLEPGTHFVPVLFDDSLSMTVADAGGKTRGQRLRDVYGASGFEEALAQSHQVALFRFGRGIERVPDISGLAFAQRESDIAGAVREVLQRLRGVSVSAVVVFSDGGQQGREVLAVADLPDDVPVFAVGVGQDVAWRDLALAGLSVTRGEEVAVTARVQADGFAGARVVVEVLDGAHAVASADLGVSGDSEEHSVRLTFAPQSRTWRAYRVRARLAGLGEERIVENNVRDFAIDNREQTYRILYFSGRPNWENRFVRRALEGAPQLSLSSLIRISGPERKFEFRGQRDATMANPLFEGLDDQALNAPRYDEAVFLRIGVGEAELASGYPLMEAELFRYHLVILGEIERDFFAQGQLELTRDFVSRRGGSLLMLGGPRSFAGGNWYQSVIEPMLPVVLRTAEGMEEAFFRPHPTVDGMLSGVWLLDSDMKRNADLWAQMPDLYGLNAFAMTRAGATVLATAKTQAGQDRPLFAWQRYGEGMSAVLATGETWPWQMMAPAGDESHARFWRQLARALVQPVPSPVAMIGADSDIVVDEVRDVRFVVRDSLFVPREGVRVEVVATGGDGQRTALPVSESMEETGVYAAAFRAAQPGLYRVDVLARDGTGAEVGRLETAVLARSDHREFDVARYNPDFLKAVAEHTGGAFFELDALDQVIAQIPWTDSQNAVVDRVALWHWPPFYAVLVLLWTAEWYLRRKRGEP